MATSKVEGNVKEAILEAFQETHEGMLAEDPAAAGEREC